MSTPPLSEPERWLQRRGGTAVEDGVGAALKRVQHATEPSDVDVARWAQRAMTARPRRTPRLIWSIAIVVAVLGGGGGAVVAGRAIWRAVKVEPVVTAARAPHASAPARARAHAHAKVLAPDLLLPSSEPEAIAEPAPPAAAATAGSSIADAVSPAAAAATGSSVAEPPEAAFEPRPTGRVARAERLATEPTFGPAPVPPPLLPDEAQLLTRAFRDLRTGGDAAAALAALDERDRRFPSGGLATEAALARAEALLALGRTDDALPILLGISDPHAGLTRDVRVARGELLARARRCAEAMHDFDDLLATTRTDAAAERARYGRASCRLAAGETAAAIADLERYLVDFPDGRFAAAVRSALEKMRRP